MAQRTESTKSCRAALSGPGFFEPERDEPHATVSRVLVGRRLNFSPTDRWPSPVEGAALEMLYSCKAILGSNPNLSASVLSQDIVPALAARKGQPATS